MLYFNNYILNIKALQNNARQIKEFIGQNVKLCAMVKADAYGHGIKDVCKGIKQQIDCFGVANTNEARIIRSFEKEKDILVVGATNFCYANWCAEHNVEITITAASEAEELVKVVKQPLKIHIKVDTGLNRFGINSLAELKQVLQILSKNKKVIIKGIFTHFATKLNDEDFIRKQHTRFMKFVKEFNNKDAVVHCCNSYAAIHKPKLRHGMIRSGFAIYGWQPDLQLTPVLNITSQLVTVQDVKAGESIGYDRSYTASKPMKIGVVPVGYADGMDRRLSNNFSVLVAGQFVPIVGNVCMDVFMVDITKLPNVLAGEKVTLLGKDGGNEVTPQAYAKTLGTSPYEILLKFKPDRMNKVLLK